MDAVTLRVAKRYIDEQLARRVANRFAGKQDRIVVKNKDTGRVVRIKPETLKERPGDFEVFRTDPGRNPHGRPDYHKEKLPAPPSMPKRDLPDPRPKPKKLPKPPTPVPVPEPPKPKRRLPLPGQKGWKPTQRT